MPSKSQSTSFFYEDLFGARKSIRYHQRRRSFFENLHTIASALQVVAGSSAVATMVSDHPYWGAGMAAIAAVLAALDLVVGTPRKATVHASLAQQFAELERAMVPWEHRTSELDATQVTEFRQRRLRIEESEPPKLRVVDILCHNELVASSYRHELVFPVGRLKRWVGHVFDVEVDDVLKEGARPPSLGDSGVDAVAAAR